MAQPALPSTCLPVPLGRLLWLDASGHVTAVKVTAWGRYSGVRVAEAAVPSCARALLGPHFHALSRHSLCS